MCVCVCVYICIHIYTHTHPVIVVRLCFFCVIRNKSRMHNNNHVYHIHHCQILTPSLLCYLNVRKPTILDLDFVGVVFAGIDIPKVPDVAVENKRNKQIINI